MGSCGLRIWAVGILLREVIPFPGLKNCHVHHSSRPSTWLYRSSVVLKIFLDSTWASPVSQGSRLWPTATREAHLLVPDSLSDWPSTRTPSRKGSPYSSVTYASLREISTRGWACEACELVYGKSGFTSACVMAMATRAVISSKLSDQAWAIHV